MPIEKAPQMESCICIGVGVGSRRHWEGWGIGAEVIKSNKLHLFSVSKENRSFLLYRCKQVSQTFDIKCTCVCNYVPVLGGDSVCMYTVGIAE